MHLDHSPPVSVFCDGFLWRRSENAGVHRLHAEDRQAAAELILQSKGCGAMMKSGRNSMDHDANAHESNQAREAALAEGYRQMAADREQEAEAEEWTEELVGDAFGVDQEPAQ
jgi:hypothetical protein